MGAGVSVWQIGFYFLRGWIGDPGLAPIAEPAAVQLGMGYFVPALAGQLSSSLLSGFNCCFSSCCCRSCCAAIGSDFWLVGSSFRPRFRFCGRGVAKLDQRICFGGHFGFCAIPVRAGGCGFRNVRHPRVRSVSRHAHLTAWYAAGFVVDLVLVLAVVSYAFYVSLADQECLAEGCLKRVRPRATRTF